MKRPTVQREINLASIMNTLFSLRAIGRNLQIPPSTISYYRDRFQSYIPVVENQGKHVKYPEEAVELFDKIRQLFSRNYSAEQIEIQLQEVRSGFISAASRQILKSEQSLDSNEQKCENCLNALQGQLADVAKSQMGIQAELIRLKDQVSRFQLEKSAEIFSHEKLVVGLHEKVENLQTHLSAFQDWFDEEVRESKEPNDRPPQSIVNQPLVVRSGREYLGVGGKRKPFALRDLIRMVRQTLSSEAGRNLHWEKLNGHWTLSITASTADVSSHEYLFEVTSTVTPSRNKVTELVQMTVDGNVAPENFVLLFFRNLKNEFR